MQVLKYAEKAAVSFRQNTLLIKVKTVFLCSFLLTYMHAESVPSQLTQAAPKFTFADVPGRRFYTSGLVLGGIRDRPYTPGAIVCSNFDKVLALEDLYVDYKSRQQVWSSAGGAESRKLYEAMHGPEEAPNPEAFGCVMLPPGTPIVETELLVTATSRVVVRFDHQEIAGFTDRRMLMGEPKLDPVNALPLSGKVEPYPIYRAEVNYPEEARQLHLEGIVRVKLTVNCDGLPNDVRVADGPRVGHGLEEEAVNNVSRWRFRPASKDGKCISSTAMVDVSFRIIN